MIPVRQTTLAVVLAAAVSGGAFARVRVDPDPAPLAGPKVDHSIKGSKFEGEPMHRTLVSRDFDGRLKRLDIHPVEAALNLMDLTPQEREAAVKPLRDRSLAIEKIVRENTRLVVELQGAFKPGDDGRGQRALGRLIELAQPVLGRSKPIDLAARALPPEKSRTLRTIVGEYMRAAVDDRMAGHVDGKKPDLLGAFIAENAALVGLEIETAANRAFGGGERDFQELSRKLQLRPDQESKIQAMFINMMTGKYEKPSKMEQMQTMLKAYALLDDDQRARLREIMAEEARDARRAKLEERRSSGK